MIEIVHFHRSSSGIFSVTSVVSLFPYVRIWDLCNASATPVQWLTNPRYWIVFHQ